MSTSVLSIRLPDELKGRLEALSRSTGRPAAYYVREAVSEHLDALEWAYDVAARAEAIRSGGRETVSHDDALVALGITRDVLEQMPAEELDDQA